MEVSKHVEQAETEADLIRRIVQGATDDFRTLVHTHQHRVFALVMRQVQHRALADELTQEVFLKAFKSLHRFRFESQFSTWITRIALNVCHSYFASRRYKQQSSTTSLEEMTTTELSDEKAVNILDRETLDRLRKALAGLSPRLREAIVLCGFEERSYQEAASILGIPVGTVRSRLNKARNILRQQMLEV